VDFALTLGQLPFKLPFLKKQAVAILETPYASSAEAARGIPAALEEYYRAEHPEVMAERAADVAQAGAALAEIHSRNVYPELGVTWGTYPDNRGHQEFPGCFRCHEGNHATAAGEVLEKDCFKCHTASAVEETSPEVLRVLGLTAPINAMRDD
jgi:cytochrome c2